MTNRITVGSCLAGIVFAVSTGSSRADPIFSTGSEHQIGPVGLVQVDPNGIIGARFKLDRHAVVTAIGGALYSPPTNSIFGAIVRLSHSGALPVGAPFEESEVVAVTTFIPSGESGDVITPLSAELEPGNYAIVFGTGHFGAIATDCCLVMVQDLEGEPGPEAEFFKYGGVGHGGRGSDDEQAMAWQDLDEYGLRFVVLGKESEPIPAISEWGVAITTLLVLSAGTIILREDPTASFAFS